MLISLFLISFALGPALGRHLPYIIGGNDVTDATKWPWQGSIEYHEEHNCGCVLLSSTWAVTAAHCASYPVALLKVRFGSLKPEEGGKLLSIIKAVMHPDWGVGSGNLPNDVAVINFADVGDSASPVTMSTTEQAGNANCYITGFGYTEASYNAIAPTLQEAKVTVYTNAACTAKWGDGAISNGHVCVGDSTNSKGACNGDSGSPLVCKVGDTWELVGVTSWGYNGCRTDYPSVYSRISYFKSWIEENM